MHMLEVYTNSKLNSVCKQNYLVPIYHYSSYCINKYTGRVFYFTERHGKIEMNEKVPYKYRKKDNCAVYYLQNDITRISEQVAADCLYTTTFYGVMPPNTRIDKMSDSYRDHVDYQWRIDSFKSSADKMTIFINGVEFKRVLYNGELATDYYVSEAGTIYSGYSGRFMIYSFQHNYYVKTSLRLRGNISKMTTIHRLVYNVWTNQNPWLPQEIQINHIDAYKNHNWLSNLEMCTPVENIRHAQQCGHIPLVYSDEIIHEMCKLMESNKYYPYEIANMLHIEYSKCQAILKNLAKGKFHRDITSQYDLSAYAQSNHFTKVPVTTIETICDLHVNHNMDRHEIKKHVSVGQNFINRVIRGDIYTDISKKYGIPLSSEIRRGLTADQIHDIAKQLMDGHTPIQIANTNSDYSLNQVRGVLNRKYARHLPITSQYEFEKVFPTCVFYHPYSSTTIERIP